MNHSYLFFLILVLIVAFATTADILSWVNFLWTRRIKKRKPTRLDEVIDKGSAGDRKEA